jgi:hypothetical protein
MTFPQNTSKGAWLIGWAAGACLSMAGCTGSTTVEGPPGVTADASAIDGANQLADGAAADGVATDVLSGDAVLPDAADSDGAVWDAPDGVLDADAEGLDGSAETQDAGDVADAGDVPVLPDAPDVWDISDGAEISDGDIQDAAETAADGLLPDAAWSPDWEGYPDASWPDGTDVYGGVITSCFNIYAYVFQEACWGKDLSTACVNSAAQDASLYTQYLFQPLRECATSLCVPGCMGASGDTFQCIQQCMGKHCSFPLFACLSQGETGTNGCPATFECLQGYKDKIISIASKCFATATAPAQKQLAAFFSCGQPPQSETCFDQLSACYGSGSVSCLGIIQCTQACAKGDDLCNFECFGQGSPKGQAQLNALWDCMFAHCSNCAGPDGCGEACHAKFCQKEQVTCLVGG